MVSLPQNVAWNPFPSNPWLKTLKKMETIIACWGCIIIVTRFILIITSIGAITVIIASSSKP